jgi:Zn-finger nucleic acid-binding protein
MLCPACKDVTLSLADRQGIEIDFCPKCRGVWLDRGELDRIIERSEQTAAPPPIPPARHDAGYDERARQSHYPQEHHYKRKKKSLLGELFDF